MCCGKWQSGLPVGCLLIEEVYVMYVFYMYPVYRHAFTMLRRIGTLDCKSENCKFQKTASFPHHAMSKDRAWHTVKCVTSDPCRLFTRKKCTSKAMLDVLEMSDGTRAPGLARESRNLLVAGACPYSCATITLEATVCADPVFKKG